MGRHSQTSSWSTTLVELGALASKSLPGSNSTGTRGRRRAQGAAKTSVAPMMYRAGGVAAALSIAVSGGAYAATQVNDGGGKSLNETEVRLAAIGSPNGSVNSQTSGLTIEGQSDSVYTVTEESTEEHGRVEKETDSLPEGETKVETEGVDGLVRTTYEVTSKDGTEVSRTPLSSSVVTEKVDEVVLVGTGSGAQKPAGEAGGGGGGGGGGEAAPAPAPSPAGDGTTPDGAQAIARSMMGSYGWGDGEFSCLQSLWNRESGWNYQAENASSGAYGIPQALPGSKMSSVAGDWATNPSTQITWGMQYIQGRYGTPCSAWAHSESVGWY
ncbi:G5 domain-containing protein [Actinomyces massiliensis]|uniref:G5 domain protein n=1 Tax=Actinomyces massiliensis F0489 TaxID=1125718 RepID=J0NE86_9ACTO|nr:G5 domain-containing protein [Actinomyces massiliensis]EJF45334.1 G5 domain protein [Actinomyces massiliensis F0489]WLD71255.1 G5 domain-containing protein [Actinomyces massiliensis]